MNDCIKTNWKVYRLLKKGTGHIILGAEFNGLFRKDQVYLSRLGVHNQVSKQEKF